MTKLRPWIIGLLLIVVVGVMSGVRKPRKTFDEEQLPISAVSLVFQDEQVIRDFISAVGAGNITLAVDLMQIEKEEEKQAWGVALNNFARFEAVSIKNVSVNGVGKYEVDLQVKLKNEINDVPIPNYGWSNGVNKRWFELVKDRERYRIVAINTGP